MIIFKFKDPVSGLTHLLAALLSIAGLVWLVYLAAADEKPWHLISFAVFGTSLVLLYTASTLYHLLPLSDRGTTILRKIDHIMIFVLIAGTYTPICLIPLRGGWGWSLFATVWGLALGGLVLKLVWLHAPRWLSTSCYLLMGWLVVIAFFPLISAVPPGGILWLVAGGFFYTTGAVIYAAKKPNIVPGIVGFHEIFHVFVIAGSVSHFWLMYRYILPIN